MLDRGSREGLVLWRGIGPESASPVSGKGFEQADHGLIPSSSELGAVML